MTDREIKKGFVLLGLQILLLAVVLLAHCYLDYQAQVEGLAPIINKEAAR